MSTHGSPSQALAAWPTLARRRKDFEAWLLERAPRAKWPELNLDDLALVWGALETDAAAVAEVERRLQRVGRAAAGRRGDDEFVEEVLQRSRHRLFVGTSPRLAGYQGRGALVQYLKAVALSVAIDLSREKKPGRDDHEDDLLQAATTEEAADQRLAHEDQKRHFTRAFRQALARLSPDERTWLRMRFVDGLSIEAVAQAFGVHRTTAMRWLEKAQRTLLDETRRILGAELRLRKSEVNSLMRDMRLSLAENLSRLLPAITRSQAR
jgi:RNA polymerase sigma-70 factor (ECF subfamily)